MRRSTDAQNVYHLLPLRCRGQDPAGRRTRVEGLISAAATLYHRGDKRGAAAAAGSLMARYPDDRRVLHAAVSLGALSENTDMTEQASRLLQVRKIADCTCTIGLLPKVTVDLLAVPA